MIVVTPAQKRMLENIHVGRNPGDGFGSGKHASRAASAVVTSLLRMELIEATYKDRGPAFRLTRWGLESLGVSEEK